MKMRMPRWMRPAAMGTLVTASFLLFSWLVSYASQWAERSGHFDLMSTEVRGSTILEQNEVVALAKIPFAQSLSEIDLPAIQQKVESYPYVKGARVSRQFPRKIIIDVMERKPIAYLNLSSFLVVDDEGIVMPLRHGDMEFNVPTLTGFNRAEELYPIGGKCLSVKTLEAVDYLSSVRLLFPALFQDISELTVDERDEYVMVLSEKPTKIHFGKADMLSQILLLKEFYSTISNKQTLHDYHYVDLRYRNQIVVRERT